MIIHRVYPLYLIWSNQFAKHIILYRFKRVDMWLQTSGVKGLSFVQVTCYLHTLSYSWLFIPSALHYYFFIPVYFSSSLLYIWHEFPLVITHYSINASKSKVKLQIPTFIIIPPKACYSSASLIIIHLSNPRNFLSVFVKENGNS